MNTERYPAAEAYARRMTLPLATDPVSRELYNNTEIVLDEGQARALLAEAGFHRNAGGGQAAQDAAVAILQERVELLKARAS